MAVTSRYDPQLLKGVLSLLLLDLLAEGESYGYEVVQRGRELGLPDVAEGTVSPALSRLERERPLHAGLAPSSSGPARKDSGTSAAGRAAPAQGAESWLALAS